MKIITKIITNKYILFAIGSFSLFMILVIVLFLILLAFRKTAIAQKIIWNLSELRNILSNIGSYYSSKRIQSWIAFTVGIGWLVGYDIIHIHQMDATNAALHGLFYLGAVREVNKMIQQEKKDNLLNTPQNKEGNPQ